MYSVYKMPGFETEEFRKEAEKHANNSTPLNLHRKRRKLGARICGKILLGNSKYLKHPVGIFVNMSSQQALYLPNDLQNWHWSNLLRASMPLTVHLNDGTVMLYSPVRDGQFVVDVLVCNGAHVFGAFDGATESMRLVCQPDSDPAIEKSVNALVFQMLYILDRGLPKLTKGIPMSGYYDGEGKRHDHLPRPERDGRTGTKKRPHVRRAHVRRLRNPDGSIRKTIGIDAMAIHMEALTPKSA